MHRPSNRQAELDAQVLRERRIGDRLLAAPETYAQLARRPVRMLLAGLALSAVLVMVVSVFSVAGAARSGRQRDAARAAETAATTTTEAAPPATRTLPATTIPPGVTIPPGATIPPGDPAIPDDQGVPTAVAVRVEDETCQAIETRIEVLPLFTERGELRRVDLAGLGPECAGHDVVVVVYGSDIATVVRRQAFVLDGSDSLTVSRWQGEDADQPLLRDDVGMVSLEIL